MMPLTRKIIKNGVHFISEPIAAAHSAAIGIWFPTGSRDERAGSSGVMHFIEHMLFKGTDTLSSIDIARYFDRIGGYVNAFTEREMICIYCLVPPQNAEDALRILCSMVRRSVFADAEIERERSVIVSEILAQCDDPDESGMEKAFSLMYPDHRISHPITGTVRDIESLASDTIRENYRLFIQNTSPLITAAGNLCTDRLVSIIESEFENTDPLLNPDIHPVWKSGVFFEESRFSQSQIYLSYPINESKTDTGWYSWAVINAIIGDMVSSRLFQNLREKRGLCYSVFSFYLFNRDSAFWTAGVSVPPEKTTETLSVLLSEITEIGEKGFSSDEIQEAKSHVSGELLLNADDTENRMKRLARQFFYNGTILSVEDSAEMINNINGSDIETALDSFDDKKKNLVVYAKQKCLRECKKYGRSYPFYS
ncbi:insulinase family protein [Brucepastera parasyntrophica]|uniref:M16 family metallopeptidase n=1 Tax=Brucepastera parasyntrophica TaxID=2880008 RepID=UPI00210CB205|nr:pitrilysin family protein [Brucepastera parasyntrophica]ULQ60120.1 insulinase family protein [Brucepastera parasyntrophica]